MMISNVTTSRKRALLVALLAYCCVCNTDSFSPARLCARCSHEVVQRQSITNGDNRADEGADSFSTPVSNTSDPNGNKRRRRRQADFPAFTYNVVNKKQIRTVKETSLMKCRNALGQEQVFRATTYSTEDVKRRRSPKWLDSPDILRDTKTRLRSDRSYARKDPFEYDNIGVPTSLEDLSARPLEPLESFWITTPARILSFTGAYFCFPFITRAVVQFVTMSPDQLDEITGKFAPGISILYGTFISLTLSILYNRQRTIQDNVGVECSYLVVITRNLIGLFKNNRERAIDAGQCAADQIRTLVKSSRGAELMLLMYSDPYARMRELVDEHEEELYDKRNYDGRSNSLIGNCRDAIKDLYRVRANRLSDEALALPPTHFFILNILTLLILLGYVVSIAPTLDPSGEPSNETSFLFAVLTTVYILFFNFASDLNEPFNGVYQIRRSCAASHLHQLKWLIANHPLLRGEVDFEEGEEDAGGVQIRSPGLGDLWFEKEELFVDASGEETGEDDSQSTDSDAL